MSSKSSSMIEIGQVLKPHGIYGEVKTRLYSDNFDGFIRRGYAYIKNNGGSRRISYEVVRAEPPFVYLHIDGVVTRNDAEAMAGTSLYLYKGEFEPAGEDEHYIIDLIGLKVCGTDGSQLGVLQDILQHGAADVYVVKGVRGFMFPALKRVIKNVDIKAGIMLLDTDALGEVAVYDDL